MRIKDGTLWDHPWCAGGGAGLRHPVLFLEHNLVISGPIYLKHGSCVCYNNTEWNGKESSELQIYNAPKPLTPDFKKMAHDFSR